MSKGWFGHVQLNPVTGDDLLYELEGRCVNGVWDRAYVIDLKTGEQIPVCHGEERVCLSHANYAGDGIVQFMIYDNHRTTVGFADVRKRSWHSGPDRRQSEQGSPLKLALTNLSTAPKATP